MRKATIKDMRKLAAKRGGRFLSPTYEGSLNHHDWQCQEGHVFSAIPNNIKSGRWCPICWHDQSGERRRSRWRQRHRIPPLPETGSLRALNGTFQLREVADRLQLSHSQTYHMIRKLGALGYALEDLGLTRAGHVWVIQLPKGWTFFHHFSVDSK